MKMEFYFQKAGFWNTIFANWFGIVIFAIIALLALGFLIGLIVCFSSRGDDKKSYELREDSVGLMMITVLFAIFPTLIFLSMGNFNTGPTNHLNAVRMQQSIESYYGLNIPVEVLENTAFLVDNGNVDSKSLVYSVLKSPGEQFSGKNFYIGTSPNSYKLVAHQGGVKLMSKAPDKASSDYKEVTPVHNN